MTSSPIAVASSFPPTQTMQEAILAYVRAHPESSSLDIREGIKDNSKQVLQALHRMSTEGELERTRTSEPNTPPVYHYRIAESPPPQREPQKRVRWVRLEEVALVRELARAGVKRLPRTSRTEATRLIEEAAQRVLPPKRQRSAYRMGKSVIERLDRRLRAFHNRAASAQRRAKGKLTKPAPESPVRPAQAPRTLAARQGPKPPENAPKALESALREILQRLLHEVEAIAQAEARRLLRSHLEDWLP